jgi:hypothetical protein
VHNHHQVILMLQALSRHSPYTTLRWNTNSYHETGARPRNKKLYQHSRYRIQSGWLHTERSRWRPKSCHHSQFQNRCRRHNNGAVLAQQTASQEDRSKLWVHPILKDRTTKGHFYSLYSQLREDDSKLLNCQRMSKKSFDELLRVVEEQLTGSDTRGRALGTQVHTTISGPLDWNSDI